MNKRNIAYLACVLIFALIFCFMTFGQYRKLSGSSAAPHESAVDAASGTPRNVDERYIRKLIREGRLSDREALFYHSVHLDTQKAGE